MNILITGNLSYLAESLTEELLKEDNKIVLASRNLPKQYASRKRKVSTHSVNAGDDIFMDVLSSYKFDAVIYLPTHEEQIVSGNVGLVDEGHMLSGLKNSLEISRQANAKSFIFLSSTEVYGKLQDIDESTQPVPESLNGYSLYAGEQYCEYYRKQHGTNVIILRVPFLYGEGEDFTFFYDMLNQCSMQKKVSFPIDQSKSISFLHTADLINLINQLINDPSPKDKPFINLSSSSSITYYDLSEYLGPYFPAVNFVFDSESPMFTRSVKVETAKSVYGWVDLHSFVSELDELVPQFNEIFKKQKTVKNSRGGNATRLLIKWLELLAGASLMQYLTEFTNTLIQFKYVDFRLFFVVLMASVYGLRFGLLAALLASASVLFTWYQLAFNWALISNNVGNWFPFVVYFSTGLILGYFHDKQATEIENEKKQTALIYEKFRFLYDVFNEITNLKNEFREKLVGYRDSFGKIFSITQELDSLEEDMIFLKALNNLQDFLENDSIAIYSIGKSYDFARLEVSSPALNGILTKSLDLHRFPEVLPHLKDGSIFHNSTLLADYPAYLAPVMEGNKPVAMIVIWEAAFDQRTMYYFNLFKVIKGLIQASLVRAALFANANSEHLYIPSTRILKPEAFNETLKIRMEMKNNKISDHQLIRIHTKAQNYIEIDERLQDKIRMEDIIGTDSKGNCYLVLSQADKESIQEILKRFGSMDGEYELIQDSEFNLSA